MNVMQGIGKNKKVMILITIGLCMILVSGVGMYVLRDSKDNTELTNSWINSEINMVEIEDVSGDSTSEVTNTCTGHWIDVSGSVVNSGIYCLESTKTIADALDKAGGLREEACLQWIERSLNRAELITPSKKLYIPSKSDSECLELNIISTNESLTSPASTSNKGICSNGLININSADATLLDTLPNVGPSLAGKIIDARPYKSLNDLKNIGGIGEATYGKIAPLICL